MLRLTRHVKYDIIQTSLIRRNQAFCIPNMNKHTTQTGNSTLLHHGWKLLYDAFETMILLIFVGMSLFPAQALAFVNDVELTHLTLIFNRDPNLDNVAVVGIEAYPEGKTVARVLKSSSLEVRSSLAEGTTIRVLSMAYSSTRDQTDASPFMTASGVKVGPGIIAANFLPFGTTVRIGNNIYTVADRMNSRYDGKYVIDIWKPSRFEAIQHGARILKLEVINLP
jgi:3D (Asp-Asp-Asp) domain-containing protein